MTMELHPLASTLPEMSDGEYRQLVQSIKANGLKVPLVTYQNRLLDGRHRLRACNEVGVAPRFEAFIGSLQDAETHMLSLNVHRRHLTAEQYRKVVAAELRADPSKSDRAIAAKVGVSPTTVGTVRDELEANVHIGHNAERTESSGRKARGRKPESQSKTDTGQRMRDGRRLVLPPGSKTAAERAAQIKPLAASGMTPQQIAAAIGVSWHHVNSIAKDAGIQIPARAAMGKTRALNPQRVIEECVNTLGAVARGIERIKRTELTMPRETATELFNETMDAQRSIAWLIKLLRGIAHA